MNVFMQNMLEMESEKKPVAITLFFSLVNKIGVTAAMCPKLLRETKALYAGSDFR
jgi:hypothetical protein